MDIDNDGHLDIISGCYSARQCDGAGLFWVLRGKPDGTFRLPEPIKGTDGKPLVTVKKGEFVDRICTRPFVIDWDGDGKLDLLASNFIGNVFLFVGKGNGKFSPKPSRLMAGKKPLKIKSFHGDLCIADLDGDGDLDVLSGSSDGGVQWSENQAGKGKPADMKPFTHLFKPTTYPKAITQKGCEDKDLRGPAKCTRVYVADVNADGLLDVLVGDRVTVRISGMTDKEFAAESKKQVKQNADWSKEFTKLHNALIVARSKPKVDAKEVKKLEQQRAKFIAKREKATAARLKLRKTSGFVWVYFQKK